MLNQETITGISKEISDFIQYNSLAFIRGRPKEYFEFMTKFNNELTLPIVHPDNLVKAITLKNYHNLWNIYIDDNLDINNTDKSLIASQISLVKKTFSISGTLENMILGQMLDGLEQIQHFNLILFDLEEMLSGFKYEFLISKSPELANSSDYIKYSTKTTSLKYFLNIDYALSSNKKLSDSYFIAREAYSYFEIAIKLASDIGTLEREMSVEKSLNLVVIRMIENEYLSIDDYVSNNKNKFNTNELNKVKNEVIDQSISNLKLGQILLKTINSFDTSLVAQNIDKLVKTYIKKDPFFKI